MWHPQAIERTNVRLDWSRYVDEDDDASDKNDDASDKDGIAEGDKTKEVRA